MVPLQAPSAAIAATFVAGVMAGPAAWWACLAMVTMRLRRALVSERRILGLNRAAALLLVAVSGVMATREAIRSGAPGGEAVIAVAATGGGPVAWSTAPGTVAVVRP